MNYLDDLKVLEPHLQKKLTLKRWQLSINCVKIE
jgi:hypothetical protein